MQEQRITARGVSLCMCSWGHEANPPLLILHGWLDQGASWRRTAVPLAEQGWHVLALEHRGHGCSDHTPPGTTYHFSEYIADADAVLRTVIERPVALVGHSMGGTIAAQLAALRPEWVRHLTLVEGLGPPAFSDEDAIEQLRTHLEQQSAPKTLTPVKDVDAGVARMRKMNPGLPLEEAHWLAERVLMLDNNGLHWRWDPMHRTRAAVAFDADRFRLLLRQIQCPVGLIFGEDSWYTKLPDLQERISDIKHVKHTDTLPTGHSPHMDAPKQLAQTIQHMLVDL